MKTNNPYFTLTPLIITDFLEKLIYKMFSIYYLVTMQIFCLSRFEKSQLIITVIKKNILFRAEIYFHTIHFFTDVIIFKNTVVSPVSYTHLDVYKRQAQQSLGRGGIVS